MLDLFFVKQKTAYELRISDWISDVCSSDLAGGDPYPLRAAGGTAGRYHRRDQAGRQGRGVFRSGGSCGVHRSRGAQDPGLSAEASDRAPRIHVSEGGETELSRPLRRACAALITRTEEHTSELKAQIRTPEAVVCFERHHNVK